MSNLLWKTTTKFDMKFFLRINNTLIVEFPSNMGFNDMDKLINLSAFTGMFNGVKELFEMLGKLKLIPSDMRLENMDIVVRDQKTDEFLTFSNRILYADGIRYLDYNNILGFFVSENRDYSIIGSLLEGYRDSVAKQLQKEKKHLAAINDSNFKFKSEASKGYVIDKTKESLNNLMDNMMNIDHLIFLCNKLSIDNKDYQLEKKYIEKIHKFLRFRLNGVKKRHVEINEVYLLSLAVDIYDCTQAMVSDYLPKVNPKIQKKMQYYHHLIDFYVNGVNKPASDKNTGESIEEPDNFMFLEEEDYRSLLNDDFNSSLARESVQNQIDNLTERKEKRF